MTEIRYEEMSMNAWPALESVEREGCVFRFANGYTKRANSANPLYADGRDPAVVIRYAEEFFSERRQPVIFKLLDLPRYRRLESYLESAGYRLVDPTHVMTADLSRLDPQPDPAAVLTDTFDGGWFEAFAELAGLPDAHTGTARAMLGRIEVPVAAARLLADGLTVACGYCAVEDRCAGFLDIVVRREYRGRGFGRRLMNALVGEVCRAGDVTAYLQVVAANAPALSLYRSLGFERFYGYRYRIKG